MFIDKDYLVLCMCLENFLFSGNCLGVLFNKDDCSEFCILWLDIFYGIYELSIFEYLK